MTIASVTMLLCFSGAQAHTHLESSMPADGAALASAPTELMLHFSEPTRVTSMTIQKEGEEEQTAVSVLPKSASAAVKVPVDSLSPGKYTVNWRAIGGDNHVMKGKFHFTVTGK